METAYSKQFSPLTLWLIVEFIKKYCITWAFPAKSKVFRAFAVKNIYLRKHIYTVFTEEFAASAPFGNHRTSHIIAN